jgi:hypothetical protein
MPDVLIVVPVFDLDRLGRSLCALTRRVHRLGLADGAAGGFFGGEWGYGCNFENDCFLIHRFCWCEQEGCLWCGGSTCQGDVPREPHREGCYQTRLDALKHRLGEEIESWTEPTFTYWDVPYGSKNTAKYNRAKRALCRDLGVGYELGNEYHCTCGVDREWKDRYDACACDWHQGRGAFRFGKAADAPNFWHKPTDLRVWWYKYIGRDMKTNRDPGVDSRIAVMGALASLRP